jgi:hypothetical protein
MGSKRDRNKPKNGQTRERFDWVSGIAKGPIDSFTVTYDPNTDAVSMSHVDPATLTSGRSYVRENGTEKEVFVAKSHKNETRFSGWKSIVDQFDYAIAVDTNSREIAGQKVHCTVGYKVDCHLKKNPSDGWPFSAFAAYLLLNVNGQINAETIGWHLVLKHNILPYFDPSKRLAIVTDSELGKLPSINSRTTPYYEANFLPEFATLIYASDTEVRAMPNMMLTYCDRAATNALGAIGAEGLRRDQPQPGDLNFGGFFPLRIRQPE